MKSSRRRTVVLVTALLAALGLSTLNILHSLCKNSEKVGEMSFDTSRMISETTTTTAVDVEEAVDFEIIVLTMNRTNSLRRLLDSLEKAQYGSDRVRLSIQIDHLPPSANQTYSADVVELAETFPFTHGPKVIQFANANKGLRAAWLEAWKPREGSQHHVIIFEDDLEASPMWYQYVKMAWGVYGDRTDMGGISLNRQSFIPHTSVKNFEIVNNHEPFFFKLVGSQGFSPHPEIWRRFLDFCQTVDLDTFAAEVPGLITTKWYSKHRRRGLWTPLFIYFCEQNSIYMLFVNLPSKKALVTHWRDKGEHFAKDKGPDFGLVHTLNLNKTWFPANPIKYGWDGAVVQEKVTSADAASKSADEKPTDHFVPIKLETAGTKYGAWTYDASLLTKDSIVYSVGLGEDTSWDEAIIEKHELHVWGFDPTPKSLNYLHARQELKTEFFHLVPEGLSTSEGVVTFTLPENPNHVSMRLGTVNGRGGLVDVKVNRLENWMKANGHTHLSILKIDIEGSEYDILEDWIKRNFFPMDQLLVEWHFRWLNDKSRHNRVIQGLQDCGWYVAHSQNSGQEQLFLRTDRKQGVESEEEKAPVAAAVDISIDKDFTDADSKAILLSATTAIQRNNDFVAIQLFNEGYVALTKNWICNVQNFSGTLSRTLFIATDKAAYDALTSWDMTLNIIHIDYKAPKNMAYGEYSYYSFMLFRTRLICFLLANDITLWLIESDAVWLQDPSKHVLNTKGDMVTMSDSQPPKQMIQGGFQLLRPTKPTISVWTKLLKQEAETMARFKAGDEMGNTGSEQKMMNKLINDEPGLHVAWLDPKHFCSGVYYRDADYAATVVEPKVILNNFVVSNGAKITRAKQHGHWFLTEDETCNEAAAKVLVILKD